MGSLKEGGGKRETIRREGGREGEGASGRKDKVVGEKEGRVKAGDDGGREG